MRGGHISTLPTRLVGPNIVRLSGTETSLRSNPLVCYCDNSFFMNFPQHCQLYIWKAKRENSTHTEQTAALLINAVSLELKVWNIKNTKILIPTFQLQNS